MESCAATTRRLPAMMVIMMNGSKEKRRTIRHLVECSEKRSKDIARTAGTKGTNFVDGIRKINNNTYHNRPVTL